MMLIVLLLIVTPLKHTEEKDIRSHLHAPIAVVNSMDTMPRQPYLPINFPDAIHPDNILKAEVSLSDSSIWVGGDIKKDYRIFAYEHPSTKAKPLILFSVFTKDVANNPYQCKYGAYYSADDLFSKEVKLKYKDISGQFIKAHYWVGDKVTDTLYFERKWVTFVK
jgi:hypothetical protein